MFIRVIVFLITLSVSSVFAVSQTFTQCRLALHDSLLLTEVCTLVDSYLARQGLDSTRESVAGYSVYGKYRLYRNITQVEARRNDFRFRYHGSAQALWRLQAGDSSSFLRGVIQQDVEEETRNGIFQMESDMRLESAAFLAYLYTVTLPEGGVDRYTWTVYPEPSNRLGIYASCFVGQVVNLMTPDCVIANPAQPTDAQLESLTNERTAILQSLDQRPVSKISMGTINQKSVTRVIRCQDFQTLNSTPLALVCPYISTENERDSEMVNYRDGRALLKRAIREKMNLNPGIKTLFRALLETASF